MNGSKNCNKFGVAALAAIVLLNVMEYVFHGVVLKNVYMHYQGLWNSEAAMAARRPAMLFGLALFGIVFTKIYTYGYEEGKPALWQGMRYGMWVGLLAWGMNSLVGYMVYPISLHLAWAWIVGGVVECAILGMAVASIYQPHPETA